MKHLLIIFLAFTFSQTGFAATKKTSKSGVTKSIPVSELKEYETSSQVVKQLINDALHLSEMNLTYLFGSASPKNKGMDCSGTINYLLTKKYLTNVPRQADELFLWVKNKGQIVMTKSNNFNSKEFSKLKPGDLLFWSGTYPTHRKSAITHVMLYLGKNKKGEPIMFGSTRGRTFQGKKMNGVSVFNFTLPKQNMSQRFVGYGCIPDLTCDKWSQKS